MGYASDSRLPTVVICCRFELTSWRYGPSKSTCSALIDDFKFRCLCCKRLHWKIGHTQMNMRYKFKKEVVPDAGKQKLGYSKEPNLDKSPQRETMENLKKA